VEAPSKKKQKLNGKKRGRTEKARKQGPEGTTRAAGEETGVFPGENSDPPRHVIVFKMKKKGQGKRILKKNKPKRGENMIFSRNPARWRGPLCKEKTALKKKKKRGDRPEQGARRADNETETNAWRD